MPLHVINSNNLRPLDISLHTIIIYHFYPVISYRGVQKESDELRCTRFGHSLRSAIGCPAQLVNAQTLRRPWEIFRIPAVDACNRDRVRGECSTSCSLFYVRSFFFFLFFITLTNSIIRSYSSDSIRGSAKSRPTPAKRIMRCRSAGTDAVSNVLIGTRESDVGLRETRPDPGPLAACDFRAGRDFFFFSRGIIFFVRARPVNAS